MKSSSIDMTTSQANQVDVERADSNLTRKGRHDAAYGGVMIQTDASTQPIQLCGRRD